MSVFEKCLKSDGVDVNRPVAEHLQAMRAAFPGMFPQTQAYNPYLQDAVKKSAAVLRTYKIGAKEEALPWSSTTLARKNGRPSGTDMRDAFVEAVEEVLQEAIEAIEPPVQNTPTSTWSSISKRFPVATLATKLDAADKIKICAIYDRGKIYKGHGPTTALGSGVLHAHVGNGTGLAFKWAGDTLEVWGKGVKWDKAAKGTSGYEWTTK